MKALPILKAEDGKLYFIDERLKQIRNVQNPHDFIEFEQDEFNILITIAKIQKRVITDEAEIKKVL